MARRRAQQGPQPPPGADTSVTALYQAHALGLIRLAYLMLGEREAAEDVVQEAFAGLYRRWEKLSDPGNALPYVRSSVLNGCRSQLRRHGRAPAVTAAAGTGGRGAPRGFRGIRGAVRGTAPLGPGGAPAAAPAAA